MLKVCYGRAFLVAEPFEETEPTPDLLLGLAVQRGGVRLLKEHGLVIVVNGVGRLGEVYPWWDWWFAAYRARRNWASAL